MDMVRERELNVPIFQKQKSYQAQAVRRKYIKPPFEKRISPISKGKLTNTNLSQYSILGLYSLIDNWFIISKSFLSINFHVFRYLQTTIRKLFPKLKCHYR